jgi:tetratricopeptide (TPR) repeat protein
MAAAGVLTGCPPQPPPLSTTRPAVQVDLAREEAPSLGTQPVTGGIYVPLEDAGKTLDAAAMEKARLDRGAVLERVKAKVVPETRPAATQPVASGGLQGAATKLGEGENGTPPMAVKYYLQGRELFLQGANSEAMDRLEKALQLDPEAFTVLRLMGRVCFAASQLARGSMYLERAQHLRPQDVETNYLLGRYWLERKDYDRAIYYLMAADDSPERQQTSTQVPLSAFYLGRALQAGGYHLAAAKEFERFLELASVPVPGYRYDRELSYLIDEEWTAELSAAENFARVGEYVGALPHYQKAAEAQPRDLFIASRQINALAHAGKLDAARERALALVVGTNGGGEDSIKLLAWTYRASGKEGQAIGDLRARLAKAGGNGASLALTLSAAQEYLGHGDEAFATLRGFLREHPANMEVLRRMLKRVDTPEEFLQGLAAAGAAIAADRSKQAEVTKEFLTLAESSAGAAFAKRGGLL